MNERKFENCDALLEAMAKCVADDFVEGFKACALMYGPSFLEDGFARKVPDKNDHAVDICKYVVARTGKAIPKEQCLYFDAVDFFRGEMFAHMFDIDPEMIIKRLAEKAKSELRNRRNERKEKCVASIGGYSTHTAA